MAENDHLNYSDAEKEIAFSAPSVAINRFIVASNPSGVRISFMEAAPDNGPVYLRAAVFMGTADAQVLGRILSEVPFSNDNVDVDDKR